MQKVPGFDRALFSAFFQRGAKLGERANAPLAAAPPPNGKPRQRKAMGGIEEVFI